MSSPEKKSRAKTKQPSMQSTLIPLLPDDLLLSCFARVSRLYYPTLSLVSKSFRSLISSPELYRIRSTLGRNESCLYVCFRCPRDPFPHWFTLSVKPHRTPNSSGNVLAPILIPHSNPAHCSGLVAIGSNIYNIVGPINNTPSSSVSILNCTSHTWLDAPSMREKRGYPSVNVLDGRIYVAGGCKDCNSSNWMEVFDPKTQTWEPVSCPEKVRRDRNVYYAGGNAFKRVAIRNKVCLLGLTNRMVYEPKEAKWLRSSIEDSGVVVGWFTYCVIENVIYHFSSGEFIWLDTNLLRWRKLRVLEEMPEIAIYDVELVDYGGKLAVLWDEFVPTSGCEKKMVVWCMVIALERTNSVEIVGNVEWCDKVLTVPVSYVLEKAVAATV